MKERNGRSKSGPKYLGSPGYGLVFGVWGVPRQAPQRAVSRLMDFTSTTNTEAARESEVERERESARARVHTHTHNIYIYIYIYIYICIYIYISGLRCTPAGAAARGIEVDGLGVSSILLLAHLISC